MSPRRPSLSLRRLLVGLFVLLVVLAGAAVAFVATQTPGDISHPDVEFTADPPPTVTPDPAPKQAKQDKKAKDRFIWPMYGYSLDRRRYLPAPASMRPPFVRRWAYHAGVLLEFSPIVVRDLLIVLDDAGRLVALDKRTGHVRWKRKLGTLAAETPAYANGVVCATVLARGRGQSGRVACLRARTGRTVWSHTLPSRAESSPLIFAGRLYFGSENGTVYALRVRDGSEVWRYHARGAVKGGLALADGRLYFGDYTGHAYAIRRADGRELWNVGTSGAKLGLGSGQFYSTPAVAYGRVYLGNTDGFVYSFAASSGKLAWRKGTGGYVYGSPAVAEVQKGRPTVYVGSYDGWFYALDARSGSVRWRYRDGGKVSGSATVIGDIVYFSNIGKHTTTGLGARTGQVVLRSSYGAFNPMVSDTKMMFQTGHSSLYGLRPLRRRGAASGAAGKRVHKTSAVAKGRAAHRAAQRRATHRRAVRAAHRRAARRAAHRRAADSAAHRRAVRAAHRRALKRAAKRRAARRAAARRRAARRDARG
jgi:outer membrane protein assembly factor BamB